MVGSDMLDRTPQEPMKRKLPIGIHAVERRAGFRCGYDAAPARFRRLLEALRERSGRRVAVLVDEYDKPILDALDEPDVARANRDYLRGLYAVIKESDPHVEFTLLTGVSKFSKVSLFSGLNNLKDITLDPRHATLCGYTETDLDSVFAPELPGLDRDAIRDWVQRLLLVGRRTGLQPLRPAAVVRSPRVPRPLVRDRVALVPGRHPGPARGARADPRPHGRQRCPAVGVRRRRHRHRGAAVPDRVPDDPRRRPPPRTDPLPSRLSEPGSAAEPEREPA